MGSYERVPTGDVDAAGAGKVDLVEHAGATGGPARANTWRAPTTCCSCG